jgi:hypothetical protein
MPPKKNEMIGKLLGVGLVFTGRLLTKISASRDYFVGRPHLACAL